MNYHSRRAQTTFFVWNALLAPLIPALGAYTLWRRFGQKKSAASLRGQWGIVPREVVAAMRDNGDDTTSSTRSVENAAPRFWIHAVSVGETLASRAVCRALKSAIPRCKIALSVTTDAGFEAAQSLLKSDEVDAVFYFPLDLPFVISRVLDAIHPQVFLTMETELWPNVLHGAKRRGAKTFLVNGRVSDNLQKRAPQMGAIWRWMMSNIDGFLMRSEFDSQRIVKLGAPSEKVHATGDVKLDAMETQQNTHETRAHWRNFFRLEDADLLFVAGSTHDGEDEIILRAAQILRSEFSRLRVLVAPRHLDRVPQIIELCRAMNLDFTLRSALNTKSSANETDARIDIIILDSVGELALIYAAADVAFVGGSLIKRGGHNLLEPVLCGVSVAFGPHIANFRAAAQMVKDADVGQMVHDETELVQILRQWLRDQDWRENVASRAEATLREHRGASMRVAQFVAKMLEFTAKDAESAKKREVKI